MGELVGHGMLEMESIKRVQLERSQVEGMTDCMAKVGEKEHGIKKPM